MKHKTAGLICAGGVSQSFFARLPSALAAVGPVFSSSLRIARRMANSLRAGRAVDDFALLEHCDVIWIVLADARFDRIVRDRAHRRLCGKRVIVCGSTRASELFAGFFASIATLNAVDQAERIFVAEGSQDALDVVRTVMCRDRRKLIEIAPSAKPLALAGFQFARELGLPYVAAGVETLRAAGFTRRDAADIAGRLSNAAAQSYARAGARAWHPSSAPDLLMTEQHNERAIRAVNAHAAELYLAAIQQAIRYFSPKK